MAEIENTLLMIGMPPHLLGYNYILSALDMITCNPEYLHRITKGLYFDIAAKYNTTPSRVERAMRHAIGTTWLHGNVEYMNYLFKSCVNPQKGTPTNSLFLARMYYFLNRG
ncbi:MAG: sporulation initiation factor Spo0A C-terminal domain-containing protein [Lachnospiraceae bacterium]